MPGYVDQSDADSQRNRMVQGEDRNMAQEEEQDDGVGVGVSEQQVRPGSEGTPLNWLKNTLNHI